MSAFNFVDLFAGIGGFHAALTDLGGTCVYAVEKDANAAKIYELNWGQCWRREMCGHCARATRRATT